MRLVIHLHGLAARALLLPEANPGPGTPAAAAAGGGALTGCALRDRGNLLLQQREHRPLRQQLLQRLRQGAGGGAKDAGAQAARGGGGGASWRGGRAALHGALGGGGEHHGPAANGAGGAEEQEGGGRVRGAVGWERLGGNCPLQRAQSAASPVRCSVERLLRAYPAVLGAGGAAAADLGGGGKLDADSGGPSKPLTAGAGGLDRSPSGVGEGGGEAAPRGHSDRDQPLRAISRLQAGGAEGDELWEHRTSGW